MTNELTEIAVKSALKAGEALRNGFGTSYKISSKEGRNNLVTEYDHISEKIIINMIKERFPEHSFLAEESGSTGTNVLGKINWIIDPLDGTVNFAHDIPIFSISIAAELNGELLIGVVYNPMLDELFIAEKGSGASLNGRKIVVSLTDDHLSSILVTGFPYNVSANPSHCIEHFVSIVQKGIPVRRLGSAALDLAYVAAGRFDGFWEINLHPWDVAAGVLLVREAGGNVTQYNKEPYTVRDISILATNGLIHDQIAQILSDYKLLPEQNVS
jgi:myo-inositol-1(or 4)-monophosphatase